MEQRVANNNSDKLNMADKQSGSALPGFTTADTLVMAAAYYFSKTPDVRSHGRSSLMEQTDFILGRLWEGHGDGRFQVCSVG